MVATKLFVCFCGAAPVADAAAADADRHRGKGKGKRARSLPSFRWKKLFLPGRKGKNRPPPPSSVPPPSAAEPEAKKRGVDDEGWHDAYDGGVFGAFMASSSASSSCSDSDSDSCSCSPSTSARSSTASFSPTLVSPPPAPLRPQKGSSPAAVVLCLLMVVFCGRVGATLLTSTTLYLIPPRWRGDDALDSLESDAEEDAFQANRRKVLVEKFLLGSRKNN